VKQQPTEQALCDLSIVCRQIVDASTTERATIEESINFAKQAIGLSGTTSSRAWYTLGNAQFALYYCTKSNAELNKALKAYNRAEALNTTGTNPDIYCNRASVYAYVLRFSEAEADIARCISIDPSLTKSTQIARAQMANSRIRLKRMLTLHMFTNSQEIVKSRQALVDSPLAAGSVGFAALADGVSTGKLFACKIIAGEQLSSDMYEVPYYFLAVDAMGKFGVVALFDIKTDMQSRNALLQALAQRDQRIEDTTTQVYTQFVAGATVVIADPECSLVDISGVRSEDVGAKSADSVGDVCVCVKMMERSKTRVEGQEVRDILVATFAKAPMPAGEESGSAAAVPPSSSVSKAEFVSQTF
jgi:hypothetical protein